ncbi:hypothetical protein F2Q70_00003050 [Brassica cretica]|uniref:Uncharacterized protein n=1 Tax=Brassica cretica TaxID=69181 RepID=A0A8S9J2I8_BRACR|nr:hypothetical protein F2Q70_00003050 [Brassica cretica]
MTFSHRRCAAHLAVRGKSAFSLAGSIRKEAPHPLGNANVVAVQVTTRRPAETLYKKYVTMEKVSEGSSKLLFGNWVNKRKPLPSTDWPSK